MDRRAPMHTGTNVATRCCGEWEGKRQCSSVWSICGGPPGASHMQGSYQDRSFLTCPPASILLLFPVGKTHLTGVLRVLFLGGKMDHILFIPVIKSLQGRDLVLGTSWKRWPDKKARAQVSSSEGRTEAWGLTQTSCSHVLLPADTERGFSPVAFEASALRLQRGCVLRTPGVGMQQPWSAHSQPSLLCGTSLRVSKGP